MKAIRKRLTYANVMSSIALFLVLGGAAFAATKLPKHSVGTKQLKNNAVTTAKIKKNAVTAAKIKAGAVDGSKVKDGSLTGTDINVGTLGTVPSANSANSANSAKTAGVASALAGRTPFNFYMGAGTQEIATIGAFTIKARCEINVGGEDIAALLLYTTEKQSTMDNNSGPEIESFGPEDSPIVMFEEEDTTGETNIESGEGFIAVAPGGTAVTTDSQNLGVNVAGHTGQCYFSGILEQLG